MAKKKEFSWKIFLKKGAKNFLYVILAGLASVYGNHEFYLAIAPLLMMVENYFKHK